MKLFLTIIFHILFYGQVIAQCNWYGVEVYPEERNISCNPIIIIEGFASGIDVIFALENSDSLYLKNDTSQIKLKVKEVCIGQFMVAQIVLIPERTLTLGLEYTLIGGKLPYRERLHRWNSLEKKSEPIKYIAQNSPSTSLPEIASRPVKIENYISRTSCGVSEFVTFDYQFNDNSKCLFKANVKNLQTGRTASYYIWPDKTKLFIGHGACGGPFDFEKNGLYELQLVPIDAYGNLLTPTDPVKFRSPK
ncbi:hypothetical protein [Flavihumibacter petaseus]|uniref:Uncharacterized protein n=1 Tax=Flavihumibacter petaseus NBRC 106054 TaxID=1220578 RepID=A0A0E9N698_9BACT|nr:hypothetical protein [Flavihumibacter petaseus]GAO45354.1 hypothetical protein FPE01S_05_00510 [Flavihumibacter petaseus NBRC 106054]